MGTSTPAEQLSSHDAAWRGPEKLCVETLNSNVGTGFATIVCSSLPTGPGEACARN